MSMISMTYKNLASHSLLIASAILVASWLILIIFTPSHAMANSAYTLPGGEKIVGGEASFDRSKTTLDIKQSSDRLYIDWHKGFDIGTKASVNFHQPDSNALVVNRVVGGKNNPTQIMGTLSANGRVIILDQNGVIFGKNARVDVGGLVASTGDIHEKNFLSGEKTFTIENIDNGKIINQGSISIADSGLAAFVAPHVRNDGLIIARKGTVVMGDAKSVTLDLYGDGLIEVVSDKKPRGSTIENKGKIDAEGGQVLLTSLEIDGVVKNLINLKDVYKSDQFRVANGKIILSKSERAEIAKKKAEERAQKKQAAIKLREERKAARAAKKNPPMNVVVTPPVIIEPLPAPVVITPSVVSLPNPVQTPQLPQPPIETSSVVTNNPTARTQMSLRTGMYTVEINQSKENDRLKSNPYILENYGVRLF